MKKLSEKQIKNDIQAIVGGEFPEEVEAIVGENRGQFFVRIPKLVSQRMKLETKKKVKFIVTNINKNEVKVELELVK